MRAVVLALVGTVGFMLLLVSAVLWMLQIVKAVFPHDPPPLQDGESIASHLGKLHW